ncbi:MAG: flavin reductase [Pseudomonadota bacterium]
MRNFGPNEFRSALGKFATGVTIVTTMGSDDQPVGVTANSFNSVSLEPPLVLWSLAKSAQSMNAFSTSGHFAVHILTAAQETLSNQFARKGENKFDAVDWTPGAQGSPLLQDFAARFQCKTTHQYEGGDHIIFVGEVVHFEERETAPLVYHSGAYADARPRQTGGDNSDPIDLEHGRFTDDFFLYLLSRSHFQSSFPTREKLKDVGLSETEYLAMSLISMNGQLTINALSDRLAHTGFQANDETIRGLHSKGLVVYAPHSEDALITLTDRGKQAFISILSHAKAVEEQILKHFSESEIADAKHILKRIISVTSSEIPELRD